MDDVGGGAREGEKLIPQGTQPDSKEPLHALCRGAFPSRERERERERERGTPLCAEARSPAAFEYRTLAPLCTYNTPGEGRGREGWWWGVYAAAPFFFTAVLRPGSLHY